MNIIKQLKIKLEEYKYLNINIINLILLKSNLIILVLNTIFYDTMNKKLENISNN